MSSKKLFVTIFGLGLYCVLFKLGLVSYILEVLGVNNNLRAHIILLGVFHLVRCMLVKGVIARIKIPTYTDLLRLLLSALRSCLLSAKINLFLPLQEIISKLGSRVGLLVKHFSRLYTLKAKLNVL